MKHSLEVVRRVYDDDDGVFIEIGPDRDGLNLIELSTSGESQKHYGPLRLCLNPAQARLIAKSLAAAADESEVEKGK